MNQLLREVDAADTLTRLDSLPAGGDLLLGLHVEDQIDYAVRVSESKEYSYD